MFTNWKVLYILIIQKSLLNKGVVTMKRLHWKHRFHSFFAGRLMDEGYRADEGYVTLLLEMGHQKAIADAERSIQETMIHPVIFW
jgi:hypothetical protein